MGSDSKDDSLVDSSVDSLVDSLADYESESDSVVGYDLASSTGSVLAIQDDSDSAHSVTEEYFLPTILQSIEGKF